MLDTAKQSSTVQFGIGLITVLSVLLQYKDTLVPVIDSFTGGNGYGNTVFIFINILVGVGGSFGLAKYRRDGDDKPLIRDRTVLGF